MSLYTWWMGCCWAVMLLGVVSNVLTVWKTVCESFLYPKYRSVTTNILFQEVDWLSSWMVWMMHYNGTESWLNCTRTDRKDQHLEKLKSKYSSPAYNKPCKNMQKMCCWGLSVVLRSQLCSIFFKTIQIVCLVCKPSFIRPLDIIQKLIKVSVCNHTIKRAIICYIAWLAPTMTSMYIVQYIS